MSIVEGLALLCVMLTGADDRSPERKAVAFLSAEVPAWSKANKCFSCHNNGDATRALLTASKDASLAVDPNSLADTLSFLARPETWNEHEADAPNKDARLARLQFTSTLALAVETKQIRDRSKLTWAAEKLAEDQREDGSWPIETLETLGSPVTYGRSLGTSRARTTLQQVDPKRFAPAIKKADAWLRRQEIRNIPEAAAVLLALPADDVANREIRSQGLDFVILTQKQAGGWGPHSRAAAEPFDTAIALLALSQWPQHDEVRGQIRRGRAALIASQEEDGSWIETTRPSGAESYAQRISTAGWATLALLATR